MHSDTFPVRAEVSEALQSVRQRAGWSPTGTEACLWALVCAAMVADLALTMQGIEQGYVEANPLARIVIADMGFAGFGLLKGVAIGIAATARTLVPERYALLVPGTLFVPWSAAATSNGLLLALT